MTAEQIKEHLKTVKYPGFSRDIVSFGIVKEVDVDDKRTQVRLAIVTRDAAVSEKIVSDVADALASIEGLPQPDIIVEKPQADHSGHGAPGQTAREVGRGPKHLPGIANVIAVASGKGGVGKSTVATNLACALAKRGKRVGLLDADIYGPSLPTMFGLGEDDRAESGADGQLIPLERFGVKLISMGMFVSDGAPLIWRGPMLTKALTQFLGDVRWGELDYLILDLPPGTGDVQMTLTMQVALDGGVIVTTPQDVALADVERGMRMFQDASVPVVGVVENMSFHVCPECGEESRIFGHGGGERMSEQYSVPFLGATPLLKAVRESSDAGNPAVVSDPDGEVAKAFNALADRLMLQTAEVGHA